MQLLNNPWWLTLVLGCVRGLMIEGEVGSTDATNQDSQQNNLSTAWIQCHGHGAKFYLPDCEIFRYAFANPTAVRNARIDSVQIGLKKVAQCLAIRGHINASDPFLHDAFTIALNYSQCDFQAIINGSRIIYQNMAVATLYYPPPPGTVGVSRRRQYHIPIKCTASAVANITSSLFPESNANITDTTGTTAAAAEQEVTSTTTDTTKPPGTTTAPADLETVNNIAVTPESVSGMVSSVVPTTVIGTNLASNATNRKESITSGEK